MEKANNKEQAQKKGIDIRLALTVFGYGLRLYNAVASYPKIVEALPLIANHTKQLINFFEEFFK
ncbi:hypothetical protein PTI45_03794 [Paenibacillus nuruki]|uniref:Uncharacterized protein n=1 Tax=Paenibacillus nuruki TaxID=1886670 RepID=A0A1E3KZJ5_9BACL|nr:hypothetical protein [Paenibacillus nuruki]ODP26833.1 hypothetical protein PTI45_03794 [Paenibacillus nuruki]